jgi:hypothetical protein
MCFWARLRRCPRSLKRRSTIASRSLLRCRLPRDEASGTFPVALPLILIVRLCADNASGKKGADKFHSEVAAGALGFINTVINTAGMKGLNWLGTTFLEAENADQRQLYTEAITREFFFCPPSPLPPSQVPPSEPALTPLHTH